MPVLILMRHAKAVRDHEAETDEARGLTDRGRKDAAAAGAEMISLGLQPDTALVSTAERTRQTWSSLGLLANSIRFESRLYLAQGEALWSLAQPALLSGDERVLVVAHNPGLHELAGDLVRAAHDRSRAALSLVEHMPTAAFAAFAVEPGPLEAAAPRLLAAWRPKD